LIGLGRYDEAVRDADAALAIRRAKLTPDSAATVQTLYHLGLARYAQGDTKAAKELWDDALARAPRAYRPNNPELAKLKASIAHPLPPSRNG
jgi:eukaryotic-like serine/threonine-protein kinase